MTTPMKLHHTALALALAACGPKDPTAEDTSTGAASTTGEPVTDSNSSQSSPTTSGDPTAPPDPTTPPNPTVDTVSTVTGTPPNPTSASTTSDPTAATDSTAATDDSGCSFLLDCNADLSKVECDPFSQDCPEGQKCAAFDSDAGGVWDALRCIPVMNDPKQPGEPCTAEDAGLSGVDDCDRGAICFFVSPNTGAGTCVPLCANNPGDPVCPGSTACLNVAQDILDLCLQPCADDTDCPDGQSCLLFNGALICAPT